MADRAISQLLGQSYNQIRTSIHNVNWDQLRKNTIGNTIGVTIAASQGLENAVGHAQTVVVNVEWGKLGKDAATAAAAVGEELGKPFQHVETAARETDSAEVRRDISATVRNNPKTVLIPVGVVGGAVTGVFLMGPVLGAVGLSSIGPVAGSMAAGIQSAGTAGVLFSTFQSAAMGGYGVGGVMAAFAGVGAAAGAAAGTGAAVAVETSNMDDPKPADQDKAADEDENPKAVARDDIFGVFLKGDIALAHKLSGGNYDGDKA